MTNYKYQYRGILDYDNDDKYKKNKKIKNINPYLVGILLLILFTGCFTVNKIIDSNNKNKNEKLKEVEKNKILFENFVSVIPGTKGPITVNRTLDDGEKINLYTEILDLDDNKLENFFYNNVNELEDSIEMEPKFMCVKKGGLSEEGTEGYEIVCPLHYTISIDKTFYGRYAHDDKRCILDHKDKEYPEEMLEDFRNLDYDCGTDYNDIVEKIVRRECDGRVTCSITPFKTMFPDTCKDIQKYLHLTYHCVKNKEVTIPKFAIVTYADDIIVNSIYENCISEFYQYADIHGYKFFYNRKRYDTIRNIYYMKLHVITEAIVRGLKDNEYDWIFWVDSDTMLSNPNIKLETFLPEDNNIHFIAAADINGLNAGAFLIRVNPWSLNFMMRSLSYIYYNRKMRLEFSDQTSMNNVLVTDKEDKHYVIVPQHWFNNYPGEKQNGDFIIHFAGLKDKKDGDSKQLRKEIYDNPEWFTAKTNKKLRKEVLEYYKKPKSEQKSLWIDDR
ncbi:hypothetical protein BCR32DRAFT_268809 [Anaeromyces robustus]|uniref:SUEL-type lectin domain-containing protein n=1 Tax=Anaeromyces robustus TaxID=1754192 RepID=A0A1Y1X4B1_9FUNG|nr:hypothetical protein BCR32DRAFT_268809 [Anaeromyces robustus]|eukprot:ORX80542.1 hypothetical protein BCR32DRAFT_268809 [Anaeromyces robustus]